MKKPVLHTIVVAILAVVPFCQSVTQEQRLRLFYDKPASEWNEALPIGNSRLGAMVFGNPSKEQIQLNEETIWAGEPGNNVPKNSFEKIQQIRALLAAGKAHEAQALSNEAFPRHAPEGLDYGMPYQTFGSLWLDFPEHANYTNFTRDLDIEDAVARTSYQVDQTTFKREVFASFTDNVVVVRLTSSKKKSISFSLNLTSPHNSATVRGESGQLTMSGTSSSVDSKVGKVNFKGIVRPVLKGGRLIESDDKLEIQDADEVVLYIAIGTNFKKYNDLSVDPAQSAQEMLDKAIKVKYARAIANHSKKYQEQFNRVKLDLGVSPQAAKATDVRVQEFAKSHDPHLVALYFQFGRYLLISSSQPGGQPANLQGIWNEKLSPPWDSKYTVNINTEMNYWPAEVTNLSETHEPLFAMLEDLAITGQESAKEMYKARGWNMHHNTDLWRITGVVDGGFYGMWPMGGAWLTQHIWQHYLYNGDKRFLADYYPVLKGITMFYVDVLQEEPKHNWLVVAPSMSPENGHQSGVSIAAGTTMDNQLVFDVFTAFIEASKVLGTDADFRDTVISKKARLAPMQVGKFGQLQEWMEDWDRTGDKHRHVSHLYGLYPAAQISPIRHPALFKAAEQSLVYRGDKSTGWSMGWKVNLWARLLDGNRAYKLIADQLSPAGEEESAQSGGTYPNLLDAHPPFQIDGNLGCTAGIAEMLLQSHDGALHLLPALPDHWTNGEVKGLKARGGFVVDMAWKQRRLTKLVVYSKLGGNCRIRLAEQHCPPELRLEPATGENRNPFFAVHPIKEPIIHPTVDKQTSAIPVFTEFDVMTKQGKKYVLKR
ncbi:glycoside hydrolase family 95 protein [Parapedobacter tibetensis]|uniref:glycoside hydrolase family 95 protein n=1 Tax=Parapedobacter tibetensis TaxID=2972951 RepID=UPI00214DEF71|nr:glycoside hydrolase family 95 protein [Parapedobacter tibetensis]